MSEDRNRRGRPKGTGIDDRGQLQAIAALLASDPEMKPTTAIKSLGVSDPSIIRRLRDKFHEARRELMADVEGRPGAVPGPAAEPTTGIATDSKPARTGQASAAALAARTSMASADSASRAVPARIGEAVRKAPTRTSEPPAKAASVTVATASPAPRSRGPVDVPAPQAAPQSKPAIAKASPATRPAAASPAPAKARDAIPSEAPASSTPSPSITATQTNVDPAAWLFTMCGFGILAASTALEAQLAWATSFVRLPPMAMALRQHIALNELAMTMVTPSAVTRASFH